MRRLQNLTGTALVVSVPLNMPRGWVKGHVQDPLPREEFRRWFMQHAGGCAAYQFGRLEITNLDGSMVRCAVVPVTHRPWNANTPRRAAFGALSGRGRPERSSC